MSSSSFTTLCKDLLVLSRFHKYNPILATFAGVWGTLLAGLFRIEQDVDAPDIATVLSKTGQCFLYTYILCGAGMVWNDWIDRDIDANVARTKQRPLASGRVSTTTAFLWMMVQYYVAYLILDNLLDGQQIATSLVPTTIGTILYPFGKRPLARKFYLYPQYILGYTCACPAITGWAAINGPSSVSDLSASWLPIAVLVFFWVLYLNTAYSYQDVADDVKMQVNSMYVFAGNKISNLLVILAGTVLCSIPFVLRSLGSTWLWVSWMGVWSLSFVEQLARFDPKSPASGGVIHKRNFALGMWTIVACCVELVFTT
ncbi:4-hydroxybenzoate octaprenyltransferase [Aspergillus stella-maris]|uniref:4-hydroxybenzoate octaprenyltransferase n=1 Tax=Aspergillus stella-maris TaxID=1810926 RepID=UPI003CCCFB7A